MARDDLAGWQTGSRVRIHGDPFPVPRSPFDDESLRLEFLTRLNAAQGVGLSPAKIAMRPGIPLAVLADEQARGKAIEALTWFLECAQPTRQAGVGIPE